MSAGFETQSASNQYNGKKIQAIDMKVLNIIRILNDENFNHEQLNGESTEKLASMMNSTSLQLNSYTSQF